MNKPRRGFALPAGMKEFVDGAKVSTAGEGAPPPVENPTAPPEAPEAPPAVEPAQPPAEAEKTAPAPAPAAEAAKKPWEVSATAPTAINFRPEQSLHDKMEWVCENVPKMSRLRIMREGAELLCNMLIEKHYREEK